jgi:hypothetical protein
MTVGDCLNWASSQKKKEDETNLFHVRRDIITVTDNDLNIK